MIRLTSDTNTLISAVIAKGNEFELLKLAYEGRIELVLSPSILKEFREVISRAKFGFSEKQVSDAFKQIINISTIGTPSIKLDVIKEDIPDNRILECAQAGRVDYIVSGDNHLLMLKKYEDVKIITTYQMLKIIRKLIKVNYTISVHQLSQ